MKIMDAHIPKNTHTHVWEEVCKSLGRCALASKLRIPSLGTVTAVIQLVARRQWAPTARMTAVWNFPFLPPLSPLRWLLKGPKTQSAQAGGEMFSEEREPLPAGAEAMIWQIKYGALMILFGTVSPHILIEACLELTKGFLKDGVCSEK